MLALERIRSWLTTAALCWMTLVAAAAGIPEDLQARPEDRDPRAYFFTQTFGDLREELATARAESKLGLLLFYEAEGCPYCQHMLNGIFSRQDVQDWFVPRFVSIAVDIHGDVELTDLDGVTLPSKVFSDHRKVFLTPVVSFIDLQGQEIYRHAGMVQTPEDFMLIGRYIEGGHYHDTTFTEFARRQGAAPEAAPSTPAEATDHRLDDRDGSP